jgi:transcriptional antiterminator Rof (Rho-off)
MLTTYTPISCELHDRLEALAVRDAVCELVYMDKDEQMHHVMANVKTFVTLYQAEYAVLSDGTMVRLDHILLLDGQPTENWLQIPRSFAAVV